MQSDTEVKYMFMVIRGKVNAHFKSYIRPAIGLDYILCNLYGLHKN